jgi:drug/metabolite transporter (DMT)-like permease
MIWVWLTLFAAIMQSVRTAGQKSLACSVSPMAATLVRYLFGLPFALLYLALVAVFAVDDVATELDFSRRFFVFASAAAVLQIIGTASLVVVLTRRNFAVGTAYAKTEAILTATLGALLFNEALNAGAWISVIVGVVGVMLTSMANSRPGSIRQALDVSMFPGLLAGLCFALTSLLLREASLSLQGLAVLTAAVTLVFMVSLQTLLSLIWVGITAPGQFALIRQRLQVSTFVGLTSVLGSIGWFTAMTLQNAAYVKALGQIEFIIALLITGRVFRESINRRELLGMSLIVFSVCVLLLV